MRSEARGTLLRDTTPTTSPTSSAAWWRRPSMTPGQHIFIASEYLAG